LCALCLFLATLVLTGDAHAARRVQAWQKYLSANPGTWKVRWNAQTGLPGRISGTGTKRYPGPAAKAATSFLKDNAALLGIAPDLGDVRLESTRRGLTGDHVRFVQTHGGLRVFGGEISAHMTGDGRVYQVSSGYRAGIEVPIHPRLSDTEAVSVAAQWAGVPEYSVPEPVELVVYAVKGQPRLAWTVVILAGSPTGKWLIFVDALDGTVLDARDMIRQVDGVGGVFDPNAIVATQNIMLSDENDADSAVPGSAYSTVTLLDISGPSLGRYRLEGPHVKCVNIEQPSISPPALLDPEGFVFTRNSDDFEWVMVYFHIDRVQRYLQSLGFNDVCNRSIRVDAHGASGADNSFYIGNSTGTGSLVFGDGGVDDAEDAEIVLHEYGHAIQDNQVPGFGSSQEGGAVGEGFADWLAAVFLSRYSGGFQDELVGDWDAVSYSTQRPAYLRRVDLDLHYPDDIVGQVHSDGRIWSGALWEIFNQLGGDETARATIMSLVVESHFLLTPTSGFRDAAEAVVQADGTLYGGANEELLQTVFEERGILGPEVPDDFEPNDSTAQAAPAVNATLRALIGEPGDHDCFSIAGRAGDQVTLDIDARSLNPPSTLDSVVTLYGIDGVSVVATNDDYGGSLDSFLQATLPTTGIYYIVVHDWSAVAGGPSAYYDLRIAGFTGPDQLEPDDSTIEAVTLERVRVGGVIGDAGDEDYYAVTGEFGRLITVDVDAETLVPVSSLDAVVTLLMPDGQTVLAQNDNYGNSTDPFIETLLPQTGTYFVVVASSDGVSAGPDNHYYLSVTVEESEIPVSSLSVDPAELTFEARQGAADPEGQTVSVGHVGELAVEWTASADAGWLHIMPDAGTTPAEMAVTVDSSSLETGEYSATITVDAPAALNSPQTVAVSLVVLNDPPVAYAGQDFEVVENTPGVSLDGAASDPEGGQVAFSWRQVSGPDAMLSGAQTPAPSFDAPDVTEDTELEFELVVTDQGTPPLSSEPNRVVVDVLVDTDSDGQADRYDDDDDDDGLTDEQEAALGTDPLDRDTDGDGLEDNEEAAYGTDPLLSDTDGDGFSDGVEVANGFDPLDDNDPGNIEIVLGGDSVLAFPGGETFVNVSFTSGKEPPAAIGVLVSVNADWATISEIIVSEPVQSAGKTTSITVPQSNTTLVEISGGTAAIPDGSLFRAGIMVPLDTVPGSTTDFVETFDWAVSQTGVPLNGTGASGSLRVVPLGDVSGDGRNVDAIDVQLAINQILGIPTPGTARADLNFDGNLDSIDLQRCINIVLGITE